MRPASRWVKQQSRQSENRNEPTLVPRSRVGSAFSSGGGLVAFCFPRCQSIGNTDLENSSPRSALRYSITSSILLVNISLGFGPRRARGVVE